MTKLKLRQLQLLREAIRRNIIADSCEKAKELRHRWLGLGTAAAYRPMTESGYMQFTSQIPPRGCMGWLTLTDAGVELFKEYENFFEFRPEEIHGIASYQLAGGIIA